MRQQLKIKNAGGITKTVSLLLIIVMIISVVPSVLSEDEPLSMEQTYAFSAPQFQQGSEGHAVIELDIIGADTIQTTYPGAPLLKVRADKIYLPEHAKDIHVTFSYDDMETGTLPEGQRLSPSPIPVPLKLPGSEMEPDLKTYEYIYDSHQPFGTHFTYDIGAGRNLDNEPCIIVSYHITPFILLNPAAGTYETIVGDTEVSVDYTLGELSLDDDETYDFLILAPSGFLSELQPLVNHKEDVGLDTKLISLDEIYDETYFELTEQERENYNRDDQETIKYFLYKAVDEWNVDYVLAVGGWRSFWGLDRPNIQFPIRFSRYNDGSEPGYASDQYYSFFKDYNNDTGKYFFDDWDTNNNDVIAEGVDTYDPHADVVFGRLACRNRMEVRTMVNKIITYETSAYDEEWFKKFLTITGDGFQDIVASGGSEGWNNNVWEFNIDAIDMVDGEYTLCAQSVVVNLQHEEIGEYGPVDEVHFTVDRSAPSRVTFHETDHLLLEPLDEEQDEIFPAQPIGTIVVPSDGDILGNTDVSYNPDEAYISDTTGWASVSYNDYTLRVKIKSYDPSPKDDINPPEDFGSYTKTLIWINNSEGLFTGPTKRYLLMYYEGEMECQQAHDYMDAADITFTDKKLWSSNGEWTGMRDVIDEISEGYGMVYFAGHGNPMSWGDHLPGIPGGRDDGMINGLKNFNMDFGLARYESEEGDPMFPMDHLTNGDKQPIILVGGCHNSYIDASFMKLIADPDTVLFTVLHGAWVPECFDWWLIRMPQGGGIASVGCSGLGYGYLGKYCITGLGGWINPEFFRIYAEEKIDILGEVFTQTITNYADTFGADGSNRKTIEEWVFLGDPTMKIGGYPPETGSLEVNENVSFGDIEAVGSRLVTEITNINDEDLTYFDWEIRVTGANPLGRYFGLTGTIFAGLFQGRIMSGSYNTDYVVRLRPDETLEISSQSLFGIGHFHVNVSVFDQEGELIAYRENPFTEDEEDGFLLGSRIILDHPEE